MIVLRSKEFSKLNLGGEYVEFVDSKDGYLKNKRGKIKLNNLKNIKALVKNNPKTAAAIAAGTTLAGTGVGVGIHLHNKKKQKEYSDGEGSGMGKKLAVGAGILGTAAATFAGARRGIFGAKAAMGANKAYAGLGRKLGNRTMVSDATRRMLPKDMKPVTPMKPAKPDTSIIGNKKYPIPNKNMEGNVPTNPLNNLTDIKGGLNLMK